ncbi:FAS1-like dehydratase domain-containing protein [Leucobacter celer]|uniref:FAS1-like dehydratase domain-containing protein n=1 Tax=Leucobacter celer TaxID=668625 RepID=UPI0006A7E0B3|nr:MaoC family dehydratase N-terminal domain-containing protein [Leucobacter celer]
MAEHPAFEQDFGHWIGRSETLHDIASRSAAIGLAAVLERPIAPAAMDTTRVFPLGHWLQFTPTAPMSELGDDGHPELGGFMPPLDLPRRMWAGSRIDYHSPIVIGQHLERLSTIESITPKIGSSGRLCFVVLHHEISADGELAVTDRQTIVYRDAVNVDPTSPSPRRPPRPDGPVPAGWDWSLARHPIETTLFRYSALTFNTHRIHYDLPYTTGVEGYPGLVVHGPLLATYLMDGFLRAHPDAEVASFEFTARSPIFCGEQIHVAGRANGENAEELAVIAPDGTAALTARLTYR